MATASTQRATLDDFLRAETQAPEGTRLALIDGEIVEWGANLTTRGAIHSVVMANLSYWFVNWLRAVGSPTGRVAVGEVRCQLRRDLDRVVGIDVGVWIGQQFAALPVSDSYEVPPTVAIEILSRSDTSESVWDKIHIYLESGVARVWMIDPELRTVTIHRNDAEPILFNSLQTIVDETTLPGFKLNVSDLF